MNWRSTILPVASVVALTVAAILPWGLPSEYRFVLPLLPIVAIYYWTLDRDAWLPEWSLFLAGLTLDVLSQGPLGYWALIYLVAYVASVYASRLETDTPIARFTLFTVVIVVATFVAWLAASAYFLEFLAFAPYARGVAFALALAVLVSIVLGLMPASRRTDRPVRLSRGR